MKNFFRSYKIWRGVLIYLKLILAALLIYSLWWGYHYWHQRPVVTTAPATTTFATSTLSGTIYFTGLTGTSTNTSVYAYTPTTGAITPVIDNYPATAFAHGTPQYDILTAYLASSSDPDKIAPAWYQPTTKLLGPLPGVNGYHETDIVASPDQIHYAFAYQTDPKLDPSSLTNWDIAIVDYQTGKIDTITHAAKPHFTNQGRDLLYLSATGLAEYNLQSKQSTMLEPSSGTLTNLDDFTVSNDGHWLVFTAPDINFIALFEATTTASTSWSQVNGVLTPGTHYRFPVIAPDNQYYAVTAVADADYATSTQQFSHVALQVFPLNTTATAATKVIPMTNFAAGSVRLNEWYGK